MRKDLESPYEEGTPRWDALYRARGDEVSETRPLFTGDVFDGVELEGSTGRVKKRSVAILHHPCSMRTNGVNLAWQILVAEVVQRNEFTEEEWRGNYFNLMPLPNLRPDLSSRNRHQAINFDNLYTVPPGVLTRRVACLSQFGVNLLLQRWVHFSSRVVVPTHDFHQQTVSFYEEADLIEEWCDEMANPDLKAESEACVDWLRTDRDGVTYQALLKDVQSHSVVRKAMRAELRSRREWAQDGE